MRLTAEAAATGSWGEALRAAAAQGSAPPGALPRPCEPARTPKHPPSPLSARLPLVRVGKVEHHGQHGLVRAHVEVHGAAVDDGAGAQLN